VETAAAKAKCRVEEWISRQGTNGQEPGVGILAAEGSFPRLSEF